MTAPQTGGGREHHVKCLRPFFDHMLDGSKTFEVRKDDRHYQPSDQLVLHEIYDAGECESGRTCVVRITYKLLGGRWGIADGYCVLGVEKLS